MKNSIVLFCNLCFKYVTYSLIWYFARDDFSCRVCRRRSHGLRFVGPHATVMVHDVASISIGKIEELKADVGEGERLNNKIFDNARYHEKAIGLKLNYD